MPSGEVGSPVRHFLTACGTFALNVVGRFHEYADARLAEELTIVEQRRRLLSSDSSRPNSKHAISHRTVHVD